MNLNKGWALTLGVFLGYQVAKLQDKMPWIIKAVSDIRGMMEQAVWVPDDESVEDDGDGDGS